MNINIRSECPADHQAIRNIHCLAFGGDAEARLVDELRDGGFATVSLVAEVSDQVVGHILFSPLEIRFNSSSLVAQSLAPVAVLPEFQRSGIGRLLIENGLAACRERGDRVVLVLGHPEYYTKFGFSSELAAPLHSPFGGGPAWMALELEPATLKGEEGKVEFAPPFGMFE